MDLALFSMMQSGGRNKAWAETMVNLEARRLVDIANSISAYHLHDGLTRLHFVQEIRDVIEQQFTIARNAKSDEECMMCVKALREESESLKEQDRQLRIQAAQLYAKVKFVQENNEIVGYVITAVHIVISGLAVAGGAMMISTMTPVGVLAGAILIVDGINGISKEIIPRLYGEQTKTEGIFADGAMATANFLGFKPETGLAFYKATTLTASVYSILGLARKPEAWRLFRWVTHDYYRKVDTMSRPKLTMKIVKYGVKAKVVFDLLTTDDDNN